MENTKKISVYFESTLKKVERKKVGDFCNETLKSNDWKDGADKKAEAKMILEYLPRITQIYFSKIQGDKILMFDAIYPSKIEFVPTPEFKKMLMEA